MEHDEGTQEADEEVKGFDFLSDMIGQEVMETALRNGLSLSDFRKLGEDALMQQIAPTIKAYTTGAGDADMENQVKAEIEKNIIDCDASPFIHDGWSVYPGNHIKGGQLEWDPGKIELWLSQEQKNSSIPGHELRKQLVEQKPLNANVLDYLLANPHLIPEKWKGQYVFFWGTIYRGRRGNLLVRCLCWSSDAWHGHYHWLGNRWTDGHPALVLAP